jgi:hypothetical protein
MIMTSIIADAARVAHGEISSDWTVWDRLRVVAALLPDIQEDIYTGRYSEPGRPNITSLQHIIHDSPEDLMPYLETCRAAVRRHEKWTADTSQQLELIQMAYRAGRRKLNGEE